jgi:glycosyltransferase involved in cell wall biosynthesis
VTKYNTFQMDIPLVSVVIPVFNMQEFLAQTLESVLSTVYSSFEVIIVDDGSTDDSLKIANDYSAKDNRIRIIPQQNSGVSTARNHGIREAFGKYILPVDADNLLSSNYIASAVAVLESNEKVRVVTCKSVFFGDRAGEWKLRPFSLRLLARKNMIDTCAMYRKSDWQSVNGYCEYIKGREDWDFWISLLKKGGEVTCLPIVGFKYRIRNNSKRVTDRHYKKNIISILNKRHKAFFYRELGGKLHYRRTWSRLFNFFIQLIKPEKVKVNPEFNNLDEFIYNIPELFESEGKTIHSIRNTIKTFEENKSTIVVKSFHKPNFINKLIYGNFRHSKAHRSYDYALKLIEMGIETPAPIGYYEQKCLFLFMKSYYACFQSKCPFQFSDLINDAEFPERNQILKAVGRFTADLHEKGVWHHDYSAGNILFQLKEESIEIELIDLNRIEFGTVDIQKGCKNFERLNIDAESLKIMANEYAIIRGFDPEVCISNILTMRWKKHKNISNSQTESL